MTARRSFVLINGDVKLNAASALSNAPLGAVMTLDYEPTQKLLQQRKYHAMINDIADSCTFMHRKWDAEEWKRLLIHAFVKVMREEAKALNKPDPFEGQGQVVPSLDGDGFVQLGVQSRGFSKKLASEFIEYLYSWGTAHGAIWNETADFDDRRNNVREV